MFRSLYWSQGLLQTTHSGDFIRRPSCPRPYRSEGAPFASRGRCDPEGRLILRGLVEPLLTLPARLTRPVVVRTRLPLSLPVEESVEHPVMPLANRNHTILARDLDASVRDRFNVMYLQRSTTLSGDPGEEAATVAIERAGAKLAPVLGVIQSRHMQSLVNNVPTAVDREPIFGGVFPKFLHKVGPHIWPVFG